MWKPKCLSVIGINKDAVNPAVGSSCDVRSSESELNQELSFSLRVNNELAKNGSDMQDGGGKTEEEHKEAAATKEKRKTRISRSSSSNNNNDGVLLNLHVPVPLRSPPHVPHETLPFTIEELEEREMKFSRHGCWPAFLGR